VFFELRRCYKNILYEDSTFTTMWGFLYKRFELDWFWWQFVIICQKFALILVKTFGAGDVSLQAFAACLVTFLCVMAHMFARPFVCTDLDLTQSTSLVAQFFFVFCGLMFQIEADGAEITEHTNLWRPLFYLTMAFALFNMLYALLADTRSYYTVKRIGKNYQDLTLVLKEFHATKLGWFDEHHEEEEVDIARLNLHAEGRRALQVPQNLIQRYQTVASQYPMLLDWVVDHAQDTMRTFGGHIAQFMDEADLSLAVHSDQPSPRLAPQMSRTENFTQKLKRKMAQKLKRKMSRFEGGASAADTNGEIFRLIKIEALGKHLYYLCHCTPEQRDHFRFLCSSLLGYDVVTGNEEARERRDTFSGLRISMSELAFPFTAAAFVGASELDKHIAEMEMQELEAIGVEQVHVDCAEDVEAKPNDSLDQLENASDLKI